MPPSQRGTGFIGLKQYLDLNRNSATSMANRVSGNVEQAGGAAQNRLNSAVDSFKAASDDGSVVGLDREGDENLTLEQAQGLAGQTYQGPRDLSDVADVGSIYGDLSKAGNQANATGNNTGLSTLMQKQYGQTSWGGGQLDAALAGAGGGARRMADARGAFGRLSQQYAPAAQRARDYGAANASNSEQTASFYAGKVPGLQQQQADAVKAAEVERRQEGKDVATGEGTDMNRRLDDWRERRNNGGRYG